MSGRNTECVIEVLLEMKNSGEIVEHNGRYYIPKFAPNPELSGEVSSLVHPPLPKYPSKTK